MNFRRGPRAPLAGRTPLDLLLTIVTLVLAVLSFSCGSSSHPSHNAYVTLPPADSVAFFHITNSSGALSAAGHSVPQVNTAPAGLFLDPSGKFLFVANSAGNTVSTFAVGSDGSLTQSGNPVPTGAGPRALVVDPSGQYLLVTNTTSGTISVFSIDSASGALTLQSSVSVGPQPTELLITPSGFVYVVTIANNPIAGFSFSGGVLTSMGPFFPAGKGASALAVDPGGHFLYTANTSDNTVSAFQIDPNTGQLAPVPGSPYCSIPGCTGAGSAPSALAVDPSGKFLFVSTPGSTANVWGFTINSGTGELAAITGTTPSPFSLSAGGLFLVMDPVGKFFYTGNQTGANIAGYSYDPSTGVPTAISGSPFSTGSAPGKMFITH